MYKLRSLTFNNLGKIVLNSSAVGQCSSASPVKKNPLPIGPKGVHFVRLRRPAKPTLWYVYAWRGGPQVLRVEADHRPTLTPKILAEIERLAREHQLAADPDNPTGKQLSWLIDLWVSSPEWRSLARTTHKTWGSALKLIRREWGNEPVDRFYDEKAKLKVIKWRNRRSETPRAADTGVSVLRALLKFGGPYVGSSINIAADISSLYQDGNRPEIIWSDEDIAAFIAAALEKGDQAVVDAVRLAAQTGLRRADLVTLSAVHLRPHTIVKRTQKKTKRKRPSASIPRLHELNVLLAELSTRPRQPECTTILVDNDGTSWTPDRLTRRVQEIRDHIGLVHFDVDDLDEDGQPRARKKHFHDLRGTFITRLITQLNLTDPEIADLMGWSAERVANIRKFYVDQDAYVESLVARRGANLLLKDRSGRVA